jgi:hypothetical protein
MAYVDRLLTLGGSITGNTVAFQNVFASGASVLSTDAVDLGVNRDIGQGENLYGRFQIGTAFAGGTSAEFQIIASDNANGTGNVQVIGTTGPIPIAQLTANARGAFRLNPRLASRGQRFLTGNVVNVGANSAGSMFMDIGIEIQDGVDFYGSGFAVL